MELANAVPVIVGGPAWVKKYYPILIEIVDTIRGERITYYLDDVRAWAEGDFDGVAGKERFLIQSLAHLVLKDLERIEAQHEWPPPEAQRIENRRDEIT